VLTHQHDRNVIPVFGKIAFVQRMKQVLDLIVFHVFSWFPFFRQRLDTLHWRGFQYLFFRQPSKINTEVVQIVVDRSVAVFDSMKNRQQSSWLRCPFFLHYCYFTEFKMKYGMSFSTAYASPVLPSVQRIVSRTQPSNAL